MIKLYKMKKDILHYAECWVHHGQATIHWGTVGDYGKKRIFRCWNEAACMEKFLQKYTRRGYAPFPKDNEVWIVLQWPMKTLTGSSYNHRIRKQASAVLNELLGWTGLGMVDGYDIGRTSNPEEEFALNLFCIVADREIAIARILETLPAKVTCSRLKIAARGIDEDDYTLVYHAKEKENSFFL